MSKTSLKKYIATLDAGQLREFILEFYSSRREIKEYIDFYLEPDSRAKAEKYRQKIGREFITRFGTKKRRPRRSVCKKAITEFRRFSPDPLVLADLMLYYVESAEAWRTSRPRYPMNDHFLESLTATLGEAIDLIVSEGAVAQFRDRLEAIIAKTRAWGSDFHRHLAEKMPGPRGGE